MNIAPLYTATVCDCGVTCNTVNALPTCAHPGCETTICEDCRVRCECCPKRFCPDHISKTTDDVDACPSCESIDLAADELLAADPAKDVVIIRTVTYEYRFPATEPPAVIELQDMTVIDDSGPQIHIEIVPEMKAA